MARARIDMNRRQGGASGVFIIVVLLLIAAAALAVMALSRGVAKNERSALAVSTMKSVQDALVQFVAANGRLPCPANPALDTGDEIRDGLLVACANAAGTVPWRTLGIRRDLSLDPWTNKISYRVYAAAAGSLAQEDGASMVNCDLVEPAPAGATPPAANAGGLCRATQDTLEAEFLAGKGLAVNSFGAVTSAAYVLISHGPTGRGAATSAGILQAAPTSTHEIANTGAAGPFYAEAESASGVSADDPGHFDDVIAFAGLGDLVRKAGRGGRDWPEPPPPAGYSSIRFDVATLTPVLGAPPPSGSLGRDTLVIDGATVTAFDAGGAADFSFTSASDDGIGVGGGEITSTSGEYVRIVFPRTAGKFGFTMMNFGSINILLTLYREQVSLTFFNGATTLGSVTRQACGAVTSAQASFSLDSVALFGSEFDKVEIRPISSTPIGLLGSSVYLSEVKTCAAADATCLTSLAAADPSTVCP